MLEMSEDENGSGVVDALWRGFQAVKAQKA
jgi:hypothetical protein